MSPEQVEQKLAEQKIINAEQLKQLLDLATKDESFLDNILPFAKQEACKRSPFFNTIIKSQESYGYLNDRVQSSMFDTVKMAFNTDMGGYLFSVVGMQYDQKDPTSATNIESFKKNRKSYLKTLDEFKDFTVEDTKNLLKDPDMSGIERTSFKQTVAPEIKRILLDENNVVERFSQNRNVYMFRANIPTVQETLGRFDKLLNSADSREKYNEAVTFFKSMLSYRDMKKVELKSTEVFSGMIVRDTQTCEVGLDTIEAMNYATALEKEFTGDLIEYRLLETGKDNTEELYEILVNDPRLD